MGSIHDDIERYKKGELSSSEMHKLERKALDDPFLADALEGIDGVSAREMSSDLAGLRDQLKTRTSGKAKTVSHGTWMMRIAAALTILFIGTYLLKTLTDKDAKQDVVLNRNSYAPPAPLADSIKTAESQSAKESDTEIPAAGEVASSSPTSKKKSPENLSSDADAFATEESVASNHQGISIQDNVVVSDDTQGDTDVTTAKPVESPPVQSSPHEMDDTQAAPVTRTRSESIAKSSSGYIAGQPSEAVENKKVVKGQVLDSQDGKGLPGVNVTIAGTNTGTVTDGEGYYEIALNAVNDGLQYSFIGFENQEVVPGSSDKVDVTLQPDYAQLSEVVVVGYGVAKDTLDDFPILEMASPKGGRKAYKQYLVSELRYPEQALANNVEGRVTVQFTVETTGAMSEFKVIKGIGHGCDEEVIRLIKEGPQWAASRRNTKAVRDRVRVRLKFALPKK